MLDVSLPKNDEIRIALSDVGIPFRDPGLNNSSDFILDKRTEERHEKRHTTKISAIAKTIFDFRFIVFFIKILPFSLPYIFSTYIIARENALVKAIIRLYLPLS